MDRVLVVTAHPDDVDFGAGGTVAALTDAGVTVAYCIATDGDAGGSDRSPILPVSCAADADVTGRPSHRQSAAEICRVIVPAGSEERLVDAVWLDLGTMLI